MTFLYHGSGYKHQELIPGFQRSGKLVRWDVSESNAWLYASTDIEAVKQLGVSSAFEKKWHLKEFHSNESSLLFVCGRGTRVTFEEVCELEVYIYTIALDISDGWSKNSNQHNNLDTEWKTVNTVRNIESVERLDVRSWLKSYRVEIR